MAYSSRRTCMAELPESTFLDAVSAVVSDNLSYLPPYGSGMIILNLICCFL